MQFFDKKVDAKTPISDIGEFGLIEHLTKNIKIKNKNTIKVLVMMRQLLI